MLLCRHLGGMHKAREVNIGLAQQRSGIGGASAELKAVGEIPILIRLKVEEAWWSERDFRQNAEPGAIGGSGRTKIRTIEQGTKEGKKENSVFLANAEKLAEP